MRPYIVFSPPYDGNSGGVKVLHSLCHELIKKGQRVYINTVGQSPRWPIPVATPPIIHKLATTEDAIGVYPEIIFGNPLGTRTVVRYILNDPGHLGGPKTYDESDLKFVFSEVYNRYGFPEEQVLFNPVIDVENFQNLGLPRTQRCLYIGKGGATPRSPYSTGAIEIPRPCSERVLNDILNKSKILYCYDPITALTEISRLCGCPVVMIPGTQFTKEQYSRHEFGWEGVGWGIEEMQRAIDSVNSTQFREKYMKMKEIFLNKLDKFIEITQKA